MKIFQKDIRIRTRAANEFIKITDEVEKVVKESKIKNGMVFVNALHNTAALIIQEYDESIHKDLIKFFEKILPLKEKYFHDYEGNLNATAHIKSNLLKTFLTIPLKEGKLLLGTWQNIFFVEMFEARERIVSVTVIGE
ncbi:MAG: secondary thiamine-phosphate synthase enzyme YjbQ [Candidatus Aenigmatarchaeota archaeon]